MLKAYTYKPEELGFQKWPEGILRLEGTEPEQDPYKADVYIVPSALMFLQRREQVAHLPYMYGNEERHVFFDVSDFDQTYGLKCLFIRCNLKKHMKAADPNSIPWAWPVDDFGDIALAPEGGFQYDVSFHGWISTNTRREAANSCHSGDLKCDLACYSDFYGYVHRDNRPEADRRMAAYKKSMHLSKVMLCGQSIPGVFPYRFFEAMSAGRVPILFCSDYNLPWAHRIDYESCAIMCEADQAPHAAQIIKEFLETHSVEQIIEMGKRGRNYWLTYLHRNDWPRMMTKAVEERLDALGIPPRGKG